MNCLSWNCRGLGNPRRVRELSDLVKAKAPKVVFLMETKKKKAYLERIHCHLSFDNLFIVPWRNLSGGLALFWTNELDLHIHTFLLNISMQWWIQELMTPGAWRFSTEPLKLPTEKTLGLYWGIWPLSSTFRGSTLVISMKLHAWERNQVVRSDLRDKCNSLKIA